MKEWPEPFDEFIKELIPEFEPEEFIAIEDGSAILAEIEREKTT